MTSALRTLQALRRLAAAHAIYSTIPPLVAAGHSARAAVRTAAVVELLAAAGRLLGSSEPLRLTLAPRTTETLH